MIKILLKNDTIVAFDPDHKINEYELNNYLISLIDKIDGHSQSVERAMRKEEYLIINQYANINVNTLIDVFKKFLEQSKIEYEWNDDSYIRPEMKDLIIYELHVGDPRVIITFV